MKLRAFGIISPRNDGEAIHLFADLDSWCEGQDRTGKGPRPYGYEPPSTVEHREVASELCVC